MSAPATARVLDPVIRLVPVRVLCPALIQAPAPAQVPASSHAAVPVLSLSLVSARLPALVPVPRLCSLGDNATLVVEAAAELVGDYFPGESSSFPL
jgi:hypothetical protein